MPDKTDLTKKSEDELAALRQQYDEQLADLKTKKKAIQVEIDRRRASGDAGITIDPNAPVHTIGIGG